MTNIEARYIENKNAKAIRKEKEVRLVYRGTAYVKQLVK